MFKPAQPKLHVFAIGSVLRSCYWWGFKSLPKPLFWNCCKHFLRTGPFATPNRIGKTPKQKLFTPLRGKVRPHGGHKHRQRTDAYAHNVVVVVVGGGGGVVVVVVGGGGGGGVVVVVVVVVVVSAVFWQAKMLKKMFRSNLSHFFELVLLN